MSRRVSVDKTISLTEDQYQAAKALWDGPIARDHEEAWYGWFWSQDVPGTWELFLGLESTDEDLDCAMFSVLAPAIPAGQYIALHSEYGDHWRYYFTGTDCRIEEGTVRY